MRSKQELKRLTVLQTASMDQEWMEIDKKFFQLIDATANGKLAVLAKRKNFDPVIMDRLVRDYCLRLVRQELLMRKATRMMLS